MNLERSKDTINTTRKVTSQGDSWITGTSRSHPGLTYYFNTATGEAVWHISDAEKEKAKQATKRLEKLQGGKPIKCPEPRGQPPSTVLNNSAKPPSLFSEQFLMNRISDQQSSVLTCPNMTNGKVTCHTPFNHMSEVMQGTQINIPPAIEPARNFNSYDNTLNTYNSTANPMVYNPMVWDFPHRQALHIAPAVAPVVNHSPQNVALLQTVSQHPKGFVFDSFENANQSSIITSQRQTFYPREFSHGQGVKQTKNKKKINGLKNKIDLRQKLLFKKNIFYNKSRIPQGSGLVNANINPRNANINPRIANMNPSNAKINPSIANMNPRNADINPSNANISSYIVKQAEEVHSNNLCTGMESRCEDKQLGTPSKIDLRPLKCLASPDSNSHAWYIVVDVEVLVQEFKFLTTLTDSDEKCHLMVPNRVMEVFKGFVTHSENIQIKRILRFLSQQIEVGFAYLAEKPSYVEDDSIAEAIRATCKELLDKKYHLIVLSNNNEVIEKCSSNVIVFRIKEVKNILMEHSNKELVSSGPKKSFMTNDLNKKNNLMEHSNKQLVSSGPKKSFMTNDLNYKHNLMEHSNKQLVSSGPKKSFMTNDLNKKNIIMEHSNKQLLSSGPKKSFTTDDLNKIKIIVPNDISHNKDSSPVRDVQNGSLLHIANKSKPDELVVLKNTVDAGIQTDFVEIIACSSTVNVEQKQPSNAASNYVPQSTKETILSTSDKRREITLKRSMSDQPAVDSDEIEKKKFKWRRRTNTSQSNETMPSNNDQNMNTKDLETRQSNTIGNEISILSERTLNRNHTLGHIENENLDESMESRDSSIYAENFSIEETSTSDMISNTESNFDADSIDSISNISIQQQPVDNAESNKVMYEIDSVSMEQYLRTKCDEWVSRFFQIMEEALSQVLQQEPIFTHENMRPPWTLHEAAQCIALKFKPHKSIRKAANRLSNVIFDVGDANGKINKNIDPFKYMKMYSYGVHLLEDVMEVTPDCEDIQMAMESLNKLLHDIKNPDLLCNTNDNDMSLHSDLLNNSDDEPPLGSLHEQEMLPGCSAKEEVSNDEPEENLTCEVSNEEPEENLTCEVSNEEPEENVTCEEEAQKPVKFIRRIDIKFSPKQGQGNNSILKMKSPMTQRNSNFSQHEDENNFHDANETTKKRTNDDVPTFQPKIIRKFLICPMIEEKLKYKNYEELHDAIGYETDTGAETITPYNAFKPLSNLKDDAVEPSRDVKNNLKRPLTGRKNSAKKPLRDLRNDTKKPLRDLKNDVANPISDLKDDAEKPITDLKNDAVKPISELKDNAKKPISELKDDAAKPIKYLKNDAAKPIRDLKNDSAKPISDLKNDAVKPSRVLKNYTKKPLSDLRNDAEKPLRDLKNEAAKPISDLKDATEKPIRDLKNDAVKPISEIKDNAKKPISELKDDAAKPINDLKNDAVTPISDLKNNAVKPSRVLKNYPKKPLRDLRNDAEKPLRDQNNDAAKPISDLKDDAEKSIRDLKNDAAKPISELKDDAKKPISEPKDDAAKPIRDLKNDAAEPISDLKNDPATPISDLKNGAVKPSRVLKNYPKKLLRDRKNSAKKPLRNLKNDVANPISDLKNDAAKPISDLKDDAAKPISDLKNDAAKPISDLKDDDAKPIRDLKNDAVKPSRLLKNYPKKLLRDRKNSAKKPLRDLKNFPKNPLRDRKNYVNMHLKDLKKLAKKIKRDLRNDAEEPLKDLKKDAAKPISELKDDAVKPISDLKNNAVMPSNALKNYAEQPLRDLKNDDEKHLSEVALKNDEEKSLSEFQIDADNTLRKQNNKKFNEMMKKLLKKIKRALSQARVICQKCYEELRQPEPSPTQKYQLQKCAEEGQLHTLRLCRSLESMLDHEGNNPSPNMAALLEQADIDIRYLDMALVLRYRMTVEKCKEQAGEFRNSFLDIISDVKRTTVRPSIIYYSCRS